LCWSFQKSIVLTRSTLHSKSNVPNPLICNLCDFPIITFTPYTPKCKPLLFFILLYATSLVSPTAKIALHTVDKSSLRFGRINISHHCRGVNGRVNSWFMQERSIAALAYIIRALQVLSKTMTTTRVLKIEQITTCNHFEIVVYTDLNNMSRCSSSMPLVQPV
jgi:hypothetical protein